MFHPPIAENVLRNRLYQLPAYEVNARAFGLRGAYVPWETGGTGGFARDNRINHIEIHVGPDIALFVKQYVQLTRNMSFLRDAFPLLRAISDFVVSRVNRTDEHGWMSIDTVALPASTDPYVFATAARAALTMSQHLHLTQVEGSDEIPKDVDNDLYTNAVSVQALETALDAAQTLDIVLPPRLRANWSTT